MEKKKTGLPDTTCNAFYRTPGNSAACAALTRMYCDKGGVCKFYGPIQSGELRNPCESCADYQEGRFCRCNKKDAYMELLRRCAEAGVEPVLDVSTARALHAARNKEAEP